MEPKKTTIKDLHKLIDGIENEKIDPVGNFLYKGFRIQISHYKASGTDRYMRLYNSRRENGLCIRCGKKVTKRNSTTGKLYRLCEFHRKETDKKKK